VSVVAAVAVAVAVVVVAASSLAKSRTERIKPKIDEKILTFFF
jgi:hypothetical protein